MEELEGIYVLLPNGYLGTLADFYNNIEDGVITFDEEGYHFPNGDGSYTVIATSGESAHLPLSSESLISMMQAYIVTVDEQGEVIIEDDESVDETETDTDNIECDRCEDAEATNFDECSEGSECFYEAAKPSMGLKFALLGIVAYLYFTKGGSKGDGAPT